jgi:hypothetical protein
MSEVLTLVLPEGVEPKLVQELANDLRSDERVLDAGTNAERGLELAVLAVWLTFSGEALGLVNTAFELVQRISELVKGKGIQGVTIELPNGATIAVDHASVADVKELVQSLQDLDED